MQKIEVENTKAQMRKGILEFAILLIVAQGKIYASEILEKLKLADLIVVEGTLYPLMSRLKRDELLSYEWEESKTGPPRKYYELTARGHNNLKQLKISWQELNQSINILIKNYEKNS